MKQTAYHECSYCGGEAELESEHFDPWRGDGPRNWRLVRHDCAYACQNHPGIDPTALVREFEEAEQSRSEKNFEQQNNDYWSA